MRLLILLFSFFSSLQGMSTHEKYPRVFDNYASNPSTTTTSTVQDDGDGDTGNIQQRADALRKEMHKNCDPFTWWNCITSRLSPTLLFGTACGVYSYKVGKHAVMNNANTLKHQVLEAPRYLSITAALLLSCMVYSYYKPALRRGYYYLYEKYLHWKKGY
jgi:hypothetical protein